MFDRQAWRAETERRLGVVENFMMDERHRVTELEKRLEAGERRQAKIIEAIAGEMRALSDRLAAAEARTSKANEEKERG